MPLEKMNRMTNLKTSPGISLQTSLTSADQLIKDSHVCSNVSDWIAVAYTNRWYPGLVTEVSSTGSHIVTVRFMKVVGINRFRFPPVDDLDEVDELADGAFDAL
jgi:hypothetical protein